MSRHCLDFGSTAALFAVRRQSKPLSAIGGAWRRAWSMCILTATIKLLKYEQLHCCMRAIVGTAASRISEEMNKTHFV